MNKNSNIDETVFDNTFSELPEKEKDAVIRILTPYINMKKEWFNEDGTALNYYVKMKEVIKKYPNLCQVVENEEMDEVFVSIDTNNDGTFDRNITYLKGKKIAESIDENEDFNNELSIEFDMNGKIRKVTIDEDDNGFPESSLQKRR
jgi:uncharacterized protein YuzE